MTNRLCIHLPNLDIQDISFALDQGELARSERYFQKYQASLQYRPKDQSDGFGIHPDLSLVTLLSLVMLLSLSYRCRNFLPPLHACRKLKSAGATVVPPKKISHIAHHKVVQPHKVICITLLLLRAELCGVMVGP